LARGSLATVNLNILIIWNMKYWEICDWFWCFLFNVTLIIKQEILFERASGYDERKFPPQKFPLGDTCAINIVGVLNELILITFRFVAWNYVTGFADTCLHTVLEFDSYECFYISVISEISHVKYGLRSDVCLEFTDILTTKICRFVNI
jgi:hypothetical protein